MQTEYPIISSLQNSGLQVHFEPLPRGVECKMGEMGRFSAQTSYQLSSYSSGSGGAIYCRKEHGAGELPSYDEIRATFTLENNFQHSNFKDTDTFKNYDSLLEELEDLKPSSELLNFAQGKLESRSIVLNSKNEFQNFLELSAGVVEISAFGGEVKFDEGWFSSSKSSPQGIEANERRRQTLAKPDRPAYELVCNIGDKTVYGSEFESIFIFDFSGRISCSVNLYHKYAKNSHDGDYQVLIKTRSHRDLIAELEAGIESEELAFRNLLAGLWQEKIQELNELLSKSEQIQASASVDFKERLEQIESRRRISMQESFLGDNFPETVKGVVGRGVNTFTFNPLKKSYFLPDGSINIKTYFELNTQAQALFKSSAFNFAFTYTPFGEDQRLTLYAEDPWTDASRPVKLSSCLADKDPFYQTLYKLQKIGNTDELYFKDYLDQLGQFQVKNLKDCVVYNGEDFTLSRKDEFIWYLKKLENGNYKIESFGAIYKGKLNELEVSHIQRKAGKHPLKGRIIPKNAIMPLSDGETLYLKRGMEEFFTMP